MDNTELIPKIEKRIANYDRLIKNMRSHKISEVKISRLIALKERDVNTLNILTSNS